MKIQLAALTILAGVFLSVPCPARADLHLQFNQSNYTISDVGSTVQVSLYAVQSPGGPQVDVGNELLSGGIVESFNDPLGIAAPLTAGDIVPGSAWDASSTALGTNDLEVALTSLLGISDLSNPVLLATVTYTGLAGGTTTIHASSLGPGPSFITALGDLLDPLGDTTATITVNVPEPASIGLASIGAIGLIALTRASRRRVY